MAYSPFSSTVAPSDTALAAQYNNLRKDVLDVTDGHDHDGIESHALANNSVDTDQLTDGAIEAVKVTDIGNESKITFDTGNGHTHDGIDSKLMPGWRVIYSKHDVSSGYLYVLPTSGTKQLKFTIVGFMETFNNSDTSEDVDRRDWSYPDGPTGIASDNNDTSAIAQRIGDNGGGTPCNLRIDHERKIGIFHWVNSQVTGNVIQEFGSFTYSSGVTKIYCKGYNLIIEELNGFTN